MDISVEKGVAVPMRDRVALATDVYRPAGEAEVPVLLQRTPYDKELAPAPELFKLVQGGYAVAVQDTRGRHRSGGAFEPFVAEALDGEDAIAWAADQPWSSGAVGMVGSSYVGAAQWLAAARAPAPLRAIAPAITAADYREGWTYQGGALQLGFVLTWALSFLALGDVAARLLRGEATREELGSIVADVDDIQARFPALPLDGVKSLRGLPAYYRDWLRRPDDDERWRALAPRQRYEQVTVPSLNIGGWYDLFLGGTLENFLGMRRSGGNESARRSHLLVGPWAHANMTGVFPEASYGLAAAAAVEDIAGHQVRWFDHHLKGVENGVDRRAPVRLFVMGANIWRDEDDWPLPRTEFVPCYLRSGGRANTAAGDGRLSWETPGDEPEDVYLYDPRDPVPTVGGATFLPGLTLGVNAGPRDQRRVERRTDVLCYTSEPLRSPVEVTGPIELVLHVSSSAPDTDFTGKLVDVHADGRAVILTDGILRARYRHSAGAPEPLAPGRAHELRIELGATANVFAAGHRIRLEVSSSNFPRFDRNSNTGRAVAQDGARDLVPAVNRVFHDASRASHLLLPIVTPLKTRGGKAVARDCFLG